MCENCIVMSLDISGEHCVRCPLCKVVNEQNPLDFESISEDILKSDEHDSQKKRKYDSFEEDEFLKAWKQMFAGVMKRPVNDSTQQEVIDLTDL